MRALCLKDAKGVTKMKKYRGVFLKNEREIGYMRIANRMVATILHELGKEVRPGLPTLYFEEKVRQMCNEFKVRPSFLGYLGFPFALCCSVNETIVHGFPSEYILKEGDIVSFDVGVVYEGFHGDAARTFKVGAVSEEADRLMRITRESLELGVAEARVGNELLDISRAVQNHIEGAGLHVIRRFVGHGIGTSLHEKPEVLNFVPTNPKPLPLKAGMVLAIEPMVAIGTLEVDILDDQWTANTKDKSLSAHYEHSVAILPKGPEILDVLEPFCPC